MSKVVLIAPEYQNQVELNRFIEALPSSFEREGEILWNKRNKIKAFKFEDSKEIVVKRFKPLKSIQKIGYLFRLHKARKAFLNGRELVKRGVNTPAPIACVEIKSGGLIDDAYYLCERNDMPPIEDLTYRDDWDKDLALAFAHFAASLHQKGILHHDLNDTNVRFSKNEQGNFEFSVIDINRMAFYDRIEDIPMHERIENLTRFTGRLNLYEFVIREYARTCGLEEESFTRMAVEQKKKHDRNWYRRKHLLHPFRKK